MQIIELPSEHNNEMFLTKVVICAGWASDQSASGIWVTWYKWTDQKEASAILESGAWVRVWRGRGIGITI